MHGGKTSGVYKTDLSCSNLPVVSIVKINAKRVNIIRRPGWWGVLWRKG